MTEVPKNEKSVIVNLLVLDLTAACQRRRCQEMPKGSIPGLGRSLGKGNGNHFSILAWKIPWTEETGGLQSRGSQRVGHD